MLDGRNFICSFRVITLVSKREVDVECTKGHYAAIEKDRKCPQRHSET